MGLAQGETIHGLTVLKVMGVGATASVYLVRNEKTGTNCALKVLERTSDEIRRRLVDEGRAQAKLRHPNIVQVFETVEIKGQPALLMEYVHGPSLEWLLAEKGKLSIAAADCVAVGLLAGMTHAHGMGIIHRDLKPGNVLLQRVGMLWTPKIADFGVAKILDLDLAKGRSRTQTGGALGTPAYMAPEQIRDAKSVDIRADIYSLGTIFYEMLTGEPVFPGDDLLTIFTAVVAGSYTPAQIRVPDIPSRMNNVVERCLRSEPDDRFPSCREVLHAWQVYEVPSAPSPLMKGGPFSASTRRATPRKGARDRASSGLVFTKRKSWRRLLRPVAALTVLALIGLLIPGMQVASGLPSVDGPNFQALAKSARTDANYELLYWLRHGEDAQSDLALDALLERWDAGHHELEIEFLTFVGEGERHRHQRALGMLVDRVDPWRLVGLIDHANPEVRLLIVDVLVHSAAESGREPELEPVLTSRWKKETSVRVQRRLAGELKRIRGKHGRVHDGVPVRAGLH